MCCFHRYLFKLSGPVQRADCFCWLQLFWKLPQHVCSWPPLCGSNSSAAYRYPAGSGGTAVSMRSNHMLSDNLLQILPVSPLFLISKLFHFQPSLTSNNLSQSSTSNTRSDQTRPSPDCIEYQTSTIVSGAVPYNHPTYHNIPVTIAFTANADQPASASIPFLHPLPCFKFGYHPSTSATSSVITHTASTMGSQASQHQVQNYSQARDSNTHSHSYPAATPELLHAPLPPVTAAYCFSVPEQMTISGVRGKHKQKTGGVRTAAASAVLPGSQPTAPMPTSCLAKLLSTTAQESESVPVSYKRHCKRKLQTVI